MVRFRRVAVIALAALLLLSLTIPVLAQTPQPTPEVLPELGGAGAPWAAIVIGAGVIMLAAGLALPLARRIR